MLKPRFFSKGKNVHIIRWLRNCIFLLVERRAIYTHTNALWENERIIRDVETMKCCFIFSYVPLYSSYSSYWWNMMKKSFHHQNLRPRCPVQSLHCHTRGFTHCHSNEGINEVMDQQKGGDNNSRWIYMHSNLRAIACGSEI